MKRIALLMIGIVMAVLLYSSTASLQEGNPKQLGGSLAGTEVSVDAMPQAYINGGSLHKVFIDNTNEALYDSLRAQNAIVNEIDYGSYKMLVIDENAIGGRSQIYALPVPIRDDQNLIALNGYILDTTNPDATYNALPADLRKGEMLQALRKGTSPTSGLYLVQFVGPIQDSWLDALRATGAEIVSYMPSNAYVVRANNYAAASLAVLKQQQDYIQFVGDYEPAFRLSSDLRAMRQLPAGTPIKVVVQVIDGPEAESTMATLRAIATEFEQSYQVLNYHNCELTVDAAKLAEIAKLDNVFGIDERGERRLLDEAQGQILAGNLSGSAPSGPGYLSWLSGKGFNSSQFTSFSVNVVDDAYSLTGHPDLPSSRVAFQNNPTNQTGAQGGHGFLDAHIVAGYNDGTGSAYEDSLGYNYGLGIAPWARVGATAIFGSGSSNPTSWENTAYGQGARISTNSWGYTGTSNRRYNSYAQEFDRIVRDAQSGVSGNQQLIVVFAAGNDGSAANTVSSPATAKNVITVGASENYRQTGTDGCAVGNSGADNANDIINFSSRGPVNSSGGDGRVKPDIMAPGTHIQAGVPQSNYDGSSVCNKYWPSGQTLYGWSSGTSHSCPAVAGGAALLYQDFLNKGRPAPSPAMVKAYLMNSATYMTGVGANDTLPSNNQGMGRMDLGRAFDSTPRILVDQTQTLGATGETYTVTGSVANTSQPFRVTLAWTDAPGPTTGAPWVNNLDLEVTINGTTYRGNVFSGANSTTGGTADSKNNVESVFLPAGVSGNFTVTVRATNIAGDGVPGNSDTTDQDFALVIYNANTGTSASPTIGVSPSSLSFSATAGGSNPASQTLSITNTGGGTLNWSASDNAAWLTLSSTSGTAPSNVTASVNISGLAAGTYNATITITATGATNSPVTVPVTLTVSSSGGGGGGTELIVNGGFEGSVSPWVGSGSGALYTSNGNYPHAGTGYIYMGAANSVTGEYYQQVSIPSTATGTLTFYLNVSSSETSTTTQYDRLFVEVRSTSGTLLSTLATYSNLDKGTAGVYSQRTLNVSAYKGQTVRIQFRVSTDSSLITTFRIDTVSLR
ncbi:MAG: S8 family serine peptidase [Acidobacteriota bacterium]|nr:S8 family serine peptidase [Blastocatellia bacterium]MDW8413002.1 S8 family serine peptidase [Acidobacteriota bacterium]